MGVNIPTLSPPCPLSDEHIADNFSCGTEVLDTWLKDRARRNEKLHASRTYVLCEDNRVVGYYALASGSVTASAAPRKLKRNMPDPIPVMVLGRLAIDRNYQGQGLGKALLRDAILRVLQAANIAGIKAIVVHALSEDAKRFYEEYGFIAFKDQPMTLALPIEGLV